MRLLWPVLQVLMRKKMDYYAMGVIEVQFSTSLYKL